MDQLAAYDSDSDSEGEKEEQASSSDCKKLKPEAGISDYFGLTTQCINTSSSKVSSTKEKELTARYLHVEGATVEVPEGNFWTALSEADICSNGDDLVNSRKRKLESTITLLSGSTQPKVSYKTSVPDSFFAERRQCDEISVSHHGTDSSSQHFSPKASADKTASSSSNCFLQPDSKVKVYEVHPKIYPHLNRQQTSQCVCKVSHRWAGHSGAVNRITWCSDPSFSHLLLSASMDSAVRVWNAWGKQQACVRMLTVHTKAVRDAQWNHDGRQVLSCSYDRTAAVSDVQTGQCQVQLEHSSFVSSGKYHPVTPHLVTTGTKDCIQVWDMRDPQVPVRIMTHKENLGQVQDLMFSHDGHELFSCGDVVTRESADRSIMAWDFATGVILSNQIFQERYTVSRLCRHPTQSQFVAQTQAGYIAVFSLQRPYKMNKNKRFEGHQTASYNIGMSLSHDGGIVYSGSSDGKLHCYNFSTGKRIRTVCCGEVLMDVAAHPVLSSCVAGGTWDGDIVLFQ